jgi:hypothetical protein
LGTGTHVRKRRHTDTAIDLRTQEAMAMIDVDAERTQEFPGTSPAGTDPR